MTLDLPNVPRIAITYGILHNYEHVRMKHLGGGNTPTMRHGFTTGLLCKGRKSLGVVVPALVACGLATFAPGQELAGNQDCRHGTWKFSSDFDMWQHTFVLH